MASGNWKDFTDQVEKESSNKGPGCSVGAYLNSLAKTARDAVEAAFARPELTTSAIARAMRDRGADLSSFTVRRHRRGDCSCRKNGQ